MERIAIYGKGGVGKSVIATSLSACFARMGKRVFHIGCDPKQDSSIRLVGIDSEVTTVLDALGKRGRARGKLNVINRGRLGIDCCESGGPEPGVGCAGRGVARTLELLEEEDLFAKGGYDIVIYDVLGDVVCGGFAAPMREGFAEKIVIVTSEETMSLFAANNICRAVRTHAANGIVLAGLVGNLREKDAEPAPVNLFASIVNTEVLAFVPRDEQIAEAEKRAMTVVEHAPESASAPVFEALARKLIELDPRKLELPEPLSNQEFFRFSSDL